MTTKYRRPDVTQEEDRVPWRGFLAITFAVVVIFVILAGWSWMILRGREAALRPAGRAPEYAREGFQPRGVVAGVDQRIFASQEGPGEGGIGLMLNRRKREELGRFGWVDRERGLVQIPIEDAMHLVVEEHR
ncbi:hypothetical protein SOCEGT47_042600 [Sorangium cellulosum]|uniref:Uncharacterized protein n=1 Tax=Sorangium cellulosum TaxID=56 RepID=A0A4P2Q353_SORCE|nr:hypothetical protein [Sorangium cellulosum]AUX23730.1 hypothetical protein SOCEGT47_042600 [Sorangium cellulosum]